LATELPAPKRLEPGNHEDEQHHRVREDEYQRNERGESREPHPRRHRGHRSSTVKRDNRQQVEQVEEEAGERERTPQSFPVACHTRMHAAEPILPRIGPASPTRASATALSPSDRALTTAPRNGMNIGAVALIPSLRSWITCPSSWMSSSSTKPTANG